jgi:hypothetical protein
MPTCYNCNVQVKLSGPKVRCNFVRSVQQPASGEVWCLEGSKHHLPKFGWVGCCCNCAGTKERCAECEVRWPKIERQREAEAAAMNLWVCELCGIEGEHQSRDPRKCSTQRKLANVVVVNKVKSFDELGCCNCACRHQGWRRYAAESCSQVCVVCLDVYACMYVFNHFSVITSVFVCEDEYICIGESMDG